MNRWLLALPALLLVAIAAIGLTQLLNPEKSDFERVERLAPERIFETLSGGQITFNPPPAQQTVAVNLFASWCGPCEAEHAYLEDIAAERPGQLYGILYKDAAARGKAFLDRLGDPFVEVAKDPAGQGGLDFGLTGVPETFVISPEGDILLHIRGPLDDARKQDVLNALDQ